MQVRRIAAAEMDTLAAEWRALAGGVPFRSPEWLATWWEHYGQGRELCLLAARDASGRLAGLAPWCLERSAARGAVLKFLGSGEVCSDYLGVLCLQGVEESVAEALAEWLHGGEIAWDALELDGVDAAEPSVCALAAAMERRRSVIDSRPGLNCWRLELPATWADYEAMLSKSHRKHMRRLIERCFTTGRCTTHTVTTPDLLPRAAEVLVDLHQRRRTSLGEPGCFASPQFAAFHAAVMPRLLAAGMLRLHWLELDGSPVAAEYHLAGKDVIYAYQAGVDPARLDDEPGRLAGVATLKLAIDQGFRSVDFLRGDEPYKAHWRATPRPTFEWRIVPNRPAAKLRHAAWNAKQTVKRWAKDLRTKPASDSPSTAEATYFP